MSTKIQIVKRLDAIKNLIELEDEEMIHLQIDRLKQENNEDLAEIIALLEADDYENLHEAIEKYVSDFKTAELTPHQKEIFDQVNDEIDQVIANYNGANMTPEQNFLSLKGSAGVGKTFVTSKLVKAFLDKGYKVVLTTPTHKSLHVAKYMINSSGLTGVKAMTLHSFLNIKMDTDFIHGTKSFKRARKTHAIDFEKDIDILLVDESSMISRQLLEFIAEDLSQRRMKSVLFIGDEYQLPPVDESKNAVVELPKQFALTEIVRQAKHSYIKVLANELKECIQNQQFVPFNELVDAAKYPGMKVFHDETEFLQHFTAESGWYKYNNMLLSYANRDVDRQNRKVRSIFWAEKGVDATEWLLSGDYLVAGENKSGIMNSEVIEIQTAKKSYNPTIQIEEWQFVDTKGRRGKLVDPDYLIIYNAYIQDLANHAKSLCAKTQTEERKAAWARYFATKEDYGEYKFAFASTVHKSQGSTYQNSYINMSGIIYAAENQDREMAYRMLYVAVTRASKDLVILF